jgi:DNA-3-methyladenine glycosylase II
MKFILPAKKPYSFEHTARRIAQYENVIYQQRKDCFYRVIQLDQEIVVVGIAPAPNGIEVEVNRELPEILQEELSEKLRFMFQLDFDFQSFYRKGKGHPYLGDILKQRMGMRILRCADLYESLIKTIIGQQLHTNVAKMQLRQFLERTGKIISYKGIELFSFPTPEKVAKYEYEELQQIQFSRRKAEYLIDLSRSIANKKFDLETLRKLSDDQLIKRLIQERGIGRWTAECLLMFGYGRERMLPAADIGLRNAVRQVYRLKKQPTESEVREIAKEWAPYESQFTYLLWDTLQKKE